MTALYTAGSVGHWPRCYKAALNNCAAAVGRYTYILAVARVVRHHCLLYVCAIKLMVLMLLKRVLVVLKMVLDVLKVVMEVLKVMMVVLRDEFVFLYTRLMHRLINCPLLLLFLYPKKFLALRGFSAFTIVNQQGDANL